jgi:predicted helicase
MIQKGNAGVPPASSSQSGQDARAPLKLPPLTDEPGCTETISSDEMFVQILDPATGTATFLVEVIDVIHNHLQSLWKTGGAAAMPSIPNSKSNIQNWSDFWNAYVPKALLPRLHAYELMMAPYAIAHMKIGLKLAESGYRFETEERARIYLTNALEPWQKQLPLIGFDALAHEAAAVNEIKRHKRFTVVIGNPPYSGISSNMSDYAQRIVDAYRVVDGAALNEKKLWLQDDYVKFIRKAQTTIESARFGVFGFISNHGYLDNPTFRGMRQSLMGCYKRLFVLDLHGNANKKEESPDGSEDKNVFDIRQGVAICLATRGVKEAGIYQADLWGTRESKYAWLTKHCVGSTDFSQLIPDSPYYFFEPQNTDYRAEYDKGWKINEAMPVNSAGFITARDHFVMDFDNEVLLSRICDFANPKFSDAEIRTKYFEGCGSAKYPDGDTRGWKVPDARKRVQSDKNWRDHVRRCLYRPFDVRQVYWADWMVDWPRPELTRHLDIKANRALITTRITQDIFSVFVSHLPPAHKSVSAYDVNYVFPLTTAPSSGAQRSLLFEDVKHQTNFAPAFLKACANTLQLPQAIHGLPAGLSPEDIFHYAYAVFHSPGYRSRYAEFLKIDFPRLPLTTSLDLFRALARLGGELTALHLLESPKLDKPMTKFVGSSREVVKVGWVDDTVWINAGGKKAATTAGTSGFQGVPEAVWNFHIGGYQVCEKWLKDRKGRTLTDEDIAHYHKIVIALTETIRLMSEIDELIDSHGGWPGAFAGAKG